MSIALREVKRRINSTGQIRKVTGALEKISSARLARDKVILQNSQMYTARLTGLMMNLFPFCSENPHPLTSPGRSEKICVVVFGSEMGLCGGYNNGLVKNIKSVAMSNSGNNLEVIAVGKVLSRKARRADIEIFETLKQPRNCDREDFLEKLSGRMINDFTKLKYAKVTVIFSRFISSFHQEPIARTILPVEPEELEIDLHLTTKHFSFESAPDLLRAHLLPEFIRQIISNAFLNSLTSENAARLMTMSRATENAGELLQELRQGYSRLRQENITAEMMELACSSMGQRKAGI